MISFFSVGQYPKYPSYKPTGMDWLGEIPSDWEVNKIKHLPKTGYKTFVDGDWIESPYITDEGIRLIQTGNIGIGKYIEQGFRYISEETFKDFRCTEIFPGDVLICRLAQPVGRSCIAPELGYRMITSVDVCILKPSSKYNRRYIVYSLSSSHYLEWVDALSRGSTRDRISRSMLGNFEFITPSLPEQSAIADFLDQETEKIDGLIEKYNRLIELLQEKRAAIITQAVTRGLKPDVALKDSRVEWLGEIPGHWKLYKLKTVARLNMGQSPKSEFYNTESIGVPFLQGNADFSKENPKPKIFCESPNKLSIKGDILLSVRAPIGEMNITDQKYGIGRGLCAITPFTDVYNNRYAWYSLLFLRGQLFFISTGSTYEEVSTFDVKNMLLIIPPLPEQRDISEFLDHETAKIDDLVSKTESIIEKMQEYRSALITAAVTGKIDVRSYDK